MFYNGLELVENLNKVSEEIEAIFNSYKGEELSELDAKTMDRLETKAHVIKKVLEDKLNIDGLTLIQNSGDVQEVKHFHLHLKPFYNEKQEIINIEKVYEILTK